MARPPDDAGTVREANALFYEAFENQALDAMSRTWAHGGHVVCVHPGWPRLSGWPAVRSSWETIFRNSGEMRFTLTDVRVEVRGDAGWVSCTENILTADGGKIAVSAILATNLFERDGDGWRLVLHHASHVFAALPTPPPSDE
jgi:ketosteroid isomerase-like protein